MKTEKSAAKPRENGWLFLLILGQKVKFSKFKGNVLTPQCPSLSLHAERVSWMYQSGNKHENYENQIINGGNNTVFQRKKLSKSRRLIHLGQKMIISFWMNFLIFFSRVMKHIKITKLDENRKLSKSRRLVCILKPQKVVGLMCREKAQKSGIF